MYLAARRKNHEAIKTTECREKRTASLKKWIGENPQKHVVWEENRLKALKSKESKEKRKASLKEWRDKNPELAKANAQKRAKAAAAKRSKEVCMVDLLSGKALRRFHSLHEAARWLVENGKAKNINCVSSISSVCLRKPCSTGYGYRKKAFGYDWRFADEEYELKTQLAFSDLDS